MPTPCALEDLDLDLAAGESANGRTANAYSYLALDEVTPQIRLIQLQPGSPGSPIVVSLSSVDFLPGERELQYEALSYTWGNINDTSHIEIKTGGKDGQNELLNVPTNCYEALHALRYADRSRTVWIDAICIDQTDDNEKGHQVAIMAEIYRGAAKVTAWVGQASGDSEVAFDYIREVSSHVSVDPETHRLVLVSEDSRWIEWGGDALITEHEVDALAELLSRPWFSRVWIWQEIRLGHSRAILKFGDHEIPWSALRAVVSYLAGKMVYGPSHFKLNASLDNISSLCNMRSWSVFSLLHVMRSSNCLDRRDRVFAIRGMVRWGEQVILGQPDYTKPWQAVYSGLCVDYARREFLLHFLGYITDHKEPGLPSWTPNWTSGTSGLIDYGIGRASSLSRCALVRYEDPNLTVKGHLVTTVRDVIPYGIVGAWAENDIVKHRRALSQLLRSVGRHMTLDNDHEDLSVLVDVLTFGKFAEAYEPPGDKPKFEDFANATEVLSRRPEDEELLATAVQKMTGNSLFAVKIMAESCCGMSFVFVADGKFGLAPRSTRPGDIISVILGCNFPIVLRPTVDANYEVIGPAYIGGIMHGQSLLGPLPPHYSFLWYRHRGSSYLAFQDDLDNLIRLSDPRLPPLPPEWRYMGSLDYPGREAFENMETGETRYHDEDPRCDADALEARGVQLDTITLV